MTVILVKKRSAWEQYHANREGFGDIEGPSLARMKESHDRHTKNVEVVLQALKNLQVTPWIVDGAETMFRAIPGDVVLAVGGDGTFLSASHNVGPGVSIMGINSDPKFSRGRFCTVLYPTNAQKVLSKALKKRSAQYHVPRMAVRINGHEVARRILNEALYSHTCPAAMTRVVHSKVRYACSGLWVGTGAGSTGALRSAGGKVAPLRSQLLQTVIREPFETGKKGPVVLCKKRFEFVGKTADATLYLDGPFLRVPVSFDQTMEFVVSEEPLTLVGPIPT